VASCGGAPTPAPAVPVQPVATAPLPPPPDLRPAPEPSGLIVSGRVGKLSGVFATVRGWSSLPMPQSEQLSELLIGKGVGPVVDLDQPIDFAVATTGGGAHTHAMVAVSAAVKDVDAAKTGLSEHYKLAPAANGVLLLQGLAPGPTEDDAVGDGDGGDHRACELAPAFGAAPTRVVCGMDAKSLSELGPWLTRTATRATSPSDLHVEMRMQPLKPVVSGLKRMFSVVAGGILDVPAKMQGARDAAIAVGNDLVDFALDLDTLSLDVQLADSGVGVKMASTFSGVSSAFTRLVTAHADGGSPTPAAFWQLPGDTDSATFYRGIDSNDLARLRDLLLKVLDAKLVEDGVKEADRKLLADALVKIPSTAPGVYASGVDIDAVRRARAAAAALGSAPDPLQEMEAKRVLAEELLGWHLVELDEPSSRLAAAMRDASAAWSRPGLLGMYRAKAKGSTPPVIRMAPLPKEAALTRDALHYVIELPFGDDAASSPQKTPASPGAPRPVARPKAVGHTRPLLIHVLLAGEGSRAWLAIGGDLALVGTKLAGVLAGGHGGGRSDLGFFKDARTGTGGFFTLRAGSMMTQLVGVLLSGAAGGLDLGLSSDDALEDIAHVPHKGDTPIVYTLTTQAGGPPTSVISTLQVPRAAIEDTIVGILRHAGP
jgi:hypothetical protein